MAYDFAVKITVAHGRDTAVQCVQPELLFLFDGQAQIRAGQSVWQAKENDFILFLPGESYAISAQQDFTAARLQLDYHFLYQHLGGKVWYLQCNSVMPGEDKGRAALYAGLLDVIQRLLTDYADSVNTESTRYLVRSLELYQKLEDDFAGDSAAPGGRKDMDSWTIQVLDYIYLHYAEHISLTDIAAEVYTSASTLSRHFSSTMGLSFVDYLKRFRLDRVRDALESREDSITQIALENGFPSSSSMTHAFQETFAETPGDYRRRVRAAAKTSSDRETAAALRKFRRDLKKDGESSLPEHAVRTIAADSSGAQEAGTGAAYEDRIQILNIGPAAQMLGGGLERQILFLHEHFHFAYYRLWSLFTPDLIMVQKKTGRINYSRLDEVLDFFVSHHMNLFLDLGRMTNLTRVDEKSYIEGSREARFASAEEWRSYLNRFLAHIVERYGEKTTGDWIFEFSFFLNLHPYYEGSGYRAQTVWESAYRAVKRMIPSARVAGPGLIATEDENSMDMLIGDFLKSSCVPDLFTAMHFPYRADAHQVDANLRKVVQRDFMERQIRLVRKKLSAYGYQGPCCITDWNCSLSNRNFIEDSCYRAAFLVREYVKNRDAAAAFGIFYASDLISNYADSAGLLSGCAGILSRDGIGKPVYYALDFLKRLQGRVIASGEGYILTSYGHGSYQLLCCNRLSPGPRYYLTEETDSKPEDLAKIFEKYTGLAIDFCLEHAAGTRYIIRQSILNETHGDLLKNWLDLGAPLSSPEETAYLRQITVPRLERSELRAEDGTIRLRLNLKPNEVRLVELTEESG